MWLHSLKLLWKETKDNFYKATTQDKTLQAYDIAQTWLPIVKKCASNLFFFCISHEIREYTSHFEYTILPPHQNHIFLFIINTKKKIWL